MYYIAFPLGFVFGLFASSQILYPIFYSLPRLAEYRRRGLLKKEPPLWYTLITPIIWILLIWGSIWFFDNFFLEDKMHYLIGFGVGAFLVLLQIPLKSTNLEVDFKHSYRMFLKEESQRDNATIERILDYYLKNESESDNTEIKNEENK